MTSRIDFVATLEAALSTVQEEETVLRARLDDLAAERRGLELALARHRVPVPFLEATAEASMTIGGSLAHSTPVTEIPKLEDLVPSEASAPEMPPERAATVAEEIKAAELADRERPDPADLEQPEATMTDLVTDILRAAMRPLGPKDIVDELGQIGIPQEDTTTVRSTLGYLNRKGLLTKLGRGAWVLKSGPLDPGEDHTLVIRPGTLTDTETPTAESAEGVSENELPVEGGQYQPASLAG